ncbi:Competence protein ComGC [Weissella viridescens]|uniref:Competence protein ComGC n=1 Tax=Weissella viridescens TaxID=1629 RepID=A0A380P8L1_WEIVI|nr:Competence protein ComGC [Weissella viridescens]
MNGLEQIKKRTGFTLIEVITTIFIMSLLMMLVLPNVNRIRQFAEKSRVKHFVTMFKIKWIFLKDNIQDMMFHYQAWRNTDLCLKPKLNSLNVRNSFYVVTKLNDLNNGR